MWMSLNRVSYLYPSLRNVPASSARLTLHARQMFADTLAQDLKVTPKQAAELAEKDAGDP